MQITVQNLSFGYNKEKEILSDINLSINENKIVAIVGASGCGKSTFLRLLCGILGKKNNSSFQGQIKVGNLTPSEYTKNEKVGFMFQDATLFPNLSVSDNISLPLKFNSSLSDTFNVSELLSIVGLAKYKNYFPSMLSGGMKTRVALARTFITKPSLLLLDEPFSALDINWRYTLYRELEELRAKFAPMIIIVTHDIQEALILSNHIIVFGIEGKIIEEINMEKPLPRLSNFDVFGEMNTEYLHIKNLITENAKSNNP